MAAHLGVAEGSEDSSAAEARSDRGLEVGWTAPAGTEMATKSAHSCPSSVSALESGGVEPFGGAIGPVELRESGLEECELMRADRDGRDVESSRKTIRGWHS